MREHTKIVLPKLGESILSATVIQWYKNPGDLVLKDEPLLEVNTDKVASEIPSPISGILIEQCAGVGQEIQVGEALALLSSERQSHHLISPLATEQAMQSVDQTSNETMLTPAVLRLLQEKKIPFADIAKIPHTGHGGRLTKKDVEGYCPLKSAPVAPSDVERIKMSPLRKAIADNMVKSFYDAPHASLLTEVDVTAVMALIAKEKEAFFKEHGIKLTITAFVARAITRAVQAYPLLNASIEGDTILQKKKINLGIAVGIDQGVMVPVIRDCQTLDLVALAKEVAKLADKARSQTLSPTDVQEGTITMTNFGMAGIQIGIPIIRHPEVAIIGLGSIAKKVVPLADDTLAIRSIMMVTLTFDHRALDGLYGCGFLKKIKDDLEEQLQL